MTPHDEKPPRGVLTLAFWAALVLSAVLIGAGGAVGFFGARLFPAAHHPWQGAAPPLHRPASAARSGRPL